ncbi:hypothetical protein [Mycolicibacterium confluentis]|uniref:Uncharacterized protein n=1 Tax=Mycolicibacterium confluentis TaxID=28047 RepID=A0A7I7XQZ3_9MYCO|nr:hypothetical protein [Mycolicibacterium confluentis]MCV7320995.1 hypothetical protein [Mycolicibacterium confluentis]ORV25889.1 hypothetical protein AWB99_21115 [Mycolicibacterium confluentis]BBZ31639.1 hypothetical protein MCNF_02440 [Mycolicibacterium confluentis]
MHIAGNVASITESGRASARSHRGKFLAAGVAMTTAAAVAVTPALVTPTLPEVHVASPSSMEAVNLSAFDNPLTVWQQTFANTFQTIATTTPTQTSLVESISLAGNKLTAALSNPAVQAQFGAVLGNVTNPARVLGALANIPGYLDRIGAAGNGSGEALQAALAELPTVLQQAAAALAQGNIIGAFGEVNEWFLADVLSGGRAEFLDALRVPGDFFDALGIEPLARILGTSWMATPNNAGQLDGPGLLSRTVVGNLGRALLAPAVTALFQTLEIVDDAAKALQANDYETAISSLINAPAKITNAFFNGFRPKFLDDGSVPPGPGQNFPGFFSPTGTVDFFFRQIPEAIATALTFPRPAPAPNAITSTDAGAKLVSNSATDPAVDRKVLNISLPGAPDAPSGGVDAPEAPAGETPKTPTGELDPEKPAPTLSVKERITQVRADAAEQRQERAEKARAAVEKLGSNIRKGLGIDRSKNAGATPTGAAGEGQGSGGSQSESNDNSGGNSED